MNMLMGHQTSLGLKITDIEELSCAASPSFHGWVITEYSVAGGKVPYIGLWRLSTL